MPDPSNNFMTGLMQGAQFAEGLYDRGRQRDIQDKQVKQQEEDRTRRIANETEDRERLKVRQGQEDTAFGYQVQDRKDKEALRIATGWYDRATRGDVEGVVSEIADAVERDTDGWFKGLGYLTADIFKDAGKRKQDKESISKIIGGANDIGLLNGNRQHFRDDGSAIPITDSNLIDGMNELYRDQLGDGKKIAAIVPMKSGDGKVMFAFQLKVPSFDHQDGFYPAPVTVNRSPDASDPVKLYDMDTIAEDIMKRHQLINFADAGEFVISDNGKAAFKNREGVTNFIRQLMISKGDTTIRATEAENAKSARESKEKMEEKVIDHAAAAALQTQKDNAENARKAMELRQKAAEAEGGLTAGTSAAVDAFTKIPAIDGQGKPVLDALDRPMMTTDIPKLQFFASVGATDKKATRNTIVAANNAWESLQQFKERGSAGKLSGSEIVQALNGAKGTPVAKHLEDAIRDEPAIRDALAQYLKEMEQARATPPMYLTPNAVPAYSPQPSSAGLTVFPTLRGGR